ncbi:MAG: hypothetical protein AAF420_10870, partial [Pseudomonadota bacterium]
MPKQEDTLQGGCQCGATRYRINGQPLTFYACHCLDCQKQSSSAFGLSLWVAAGEATEEALTSELGAATRQALEACAA